jgi:hypothetical protein
MVIRYIDIDSSFRDRKTYPIAGDFVIPINSKSQTLNADTAQDPVILSFPYDAGLGAYAVNVTTGTLDVTLSTVSSSVVNFYVNSYLEVGGLFFKIDKYDPVTRIATMSSAYPGPLPALNTSYTIRFSLPVPLTGGIYQNTTGGASTSTTSITLGAAASVISGAYVGMYLFLRPATVTTPWLTTNPATSYQWSLITAYDGATKVATVRTPFLVAPPLGTVYEILRLNYNNIKSLNYAGTDVFNNPRCCRMTLKNLIIPTFKILSNTGGGYITDYPYVWVNIWSEKGRTYQQPIISNSPYSSQAMFKVVISFNQPTRYISLASITDPQPIFFKINDSLHIQILLPNGEPINFSPINYILYTGPLTYFPGMSFPIPPNPQDQLQISLLVDDSLD